MICGLFSFKTQSKIPSLKTLLINSVVLRFTGSTTETSFNRKSSKKKRSASLKSIIPFKNSFTFRIICFASALFFIAFSNAEIFLSMYGRFSEVSIAFAADTCTNLGFAVPIALVNDGSELEKDSQRILWFLITLNLNTLKLRTVLKGIYHTRK